MIAPSVPRPRHAEAVRVVFVVTSASVWPSLQPVWSACRADPRLAPRVLLVANSYNDRQSKEFHQSRAALIEADVPFSYAYEGVLADWAPDVAFLPSPYTDMLPPYLREDALEAHGVRVAYVPYGIEIGGGAFNMRYQFNLPLHNRAWRIFARSHSHRRMFARYCAAGAGHVVVTGSPRLDALARLDDCDASALGARIGGRTAILWTPHFSEGPVPAWSSFGRYRDHILDEFARRADTHALIFRPHPLLFSHLRRVGYWTAEEADAFRRRIDEAENVIFDENAAYLPAFKAADGLMGDAGSFLLEFFATGKPLLYLSPKDGIGLNDDAHLTDHLYVCEGAADITRFIANAAAGKDPMAERRRGALADFFHAPERGGVGQAIADHLVEAVSSGDDVRPRAPRRGVLQAAARAYWQGAEDSRLPPFAESDEAERTALDGLLARHGRRRSAVDVGAGEGRHTFALAARAKSVTACDINGGLLQRGRERAARRRLRSIDWRHEGLDEVQSLSRYDLTLCANVLSGFIDIEGYALAIATLRAMTKPNGLLITGERLATGEQALVYDAATGYAAIHRNAEEYLDSFARQGFVLVEKAVYGADAEAGVEDAFFVFRLAASSGGAGR